MPSKNFFFWSSDYFEKKFGVVPFGVVTTLRFGVMLLPHKDITPGDLLARKRGEDPTIVD